MTLHLVHIFPAFEVGGSQARTAALINALADRGAGEGYRHSVVSLNGDTSAAALLDGRAEVSVILAPETGGSLLSRLQSIRRSVASQAPDILITNNWGSIEWALANRWLPICPALHVESGFDPAEGAGRIRRRSYARRLALSGRVQTVVPSNTLKERAVSDWKLDPARVRCIPDGIDCERFANTAAADELLPPGFRDATVVGAVAALRPEKDLATMIDAVALARRDLDIRLVVVGDGPERERWERHAAEAGLGDAVHFTGYIEAVERVYPLFDILAMSSVTEQLPNAVLQAMAASLPVAATDVGDIPTMLPAGNRPYLSTPGDAAALSASLLALARDPARRGKLGAENRAHVFAHYSLERMVDAYDALFRSVAGQTAGRELT